MRVKSLQLQKSTLKKTFKHLTNHFFLKIFPTKVSNRTLSNSKEKLDWLFTHLNGINSWLIMTVSQKVSYLKSSSGRIHANLVQTIRRLKLNLRKSSWSFTTRNSRKDWLKKSLRLMRIYSKMFKLAKPRRKIKLNQVRSWKIKTLPNMIVWPIYQVYRFHYF